MEDLTVNSWKVQALINALRERGHEVEAPTTGSVLVDGIWIDKGRNGPSLGWVVSRISNEVFVKKQRTKIEALMYKSQDSGNDELARACSLALQGDEDALAECRNALSKA